MSNEKQIETTAELVEVTETRPLTPSERILAPLELSDDSQFLYNTNYGGKPGKDFTAERNAMKASLPIQLFQTAAELLGCRHVDADQKRPQRACRMG